MDISAIQPHVKAADVPLNQLAGNKTLTEDQKVGEASRQFEAVLLRQILTESQKSAFKSKYTDNSLAGGIYRDMTVNQLADNISKSGAFGLAKSLNKELTHQVEHK
jgi:peptidoglycan hydrolase FlgJ